MCISKKNTAIVLEFTIGEAAAEEQTESYIWSPLFWKCNTCLLEREVAIAIVLTTLDSFFTSDGGMVENTIGLFFSAGCSI